MTKISRGQRAHLLATVERLRRVQRYGSLMTEAVEIMCEREFTPSRWRTIKTNPRIRIVHQSGSTWHVLQPDGPYEVYS